MTENRMIEFATKKSLGSVQVGDGFSITDDGILSADAANIDYDYAENDATKSEYIKNRTHYEYDGFEWDYSEMFTKIVNENSLVNNDEGVFGDIPHSDISKEKVPVDGYYYYDYSVYVQATKNVDAFKNYLYEQLHCDLSRFEESMKAGYYGFADGTYAADEIRFKKDNLRWLFNDVLKNYTYEELMNSDYMYLRVGGIGSQCLIVHNYDAYYKDNKNYPSLVPEAGVYIMILQCYGTTDTYTRDINEYRSCLIAGKIHGDIKKIDEKYLPEDTATKPWVRSLEAVRPNSDWEQEDNKKKDYILNKPQKIKVNVPFSFEASKAKNKTMSEHIMTVAENLYVSQGYHISSALNMTIMNGGQESLDELKNYKYIGSVRADWDDLKEYFAADPIKRKGFNKTCSITLSNGMTIDYATEGGYILDSDIGLIVNNTSYYKSFQPSLDYFIDIHCSQIDPSTTDSCQTSQIVFANHVIYDDGTNEPDGSIAVFYRDIYSDTLGKDLVKITGMSSENFFIKTNYAFVEDAKLWTGTDAEYRATWSDKKEGTMGFVTNDGFAGVRQATLNNDKDTSINLSSFYAPIDTSNKGNYLISSGYGKAPEFVKPMSTLYFATMTHPSISYTNGDITYGSPNYYLDCNNINCIDNDYMEVSDGYLVAKRSGYFLIETSCCLDFKYSKLGAYVNSWRFYIRPTGVVTDWSDRGVSFNDVKNGAKYYNVPFITYFRKGQPIRIYYSSPIRAYRSSTITSVDVTNITTTVTPIF